MDVVRKCREQRHMPTPKSVVSYGPKVLNQQMSTKGASTKTLITPCNPIGLHLCMSHDTSPTCQAITLSTVFRDTVFRQVNDPSREAVNDATTHKCSLYALFPPLAGMLGLENARHRKKHGTRNRSNVDSFCQIETFQDHNVAFLAEHT